MPDASQRETPYLAIGRFVMIQCAALVLGLGLQCILSRQLSEFDYARFIAGVSLTSALSVFVGGATPRAIACLVATDPRWTFDGVRLLRRVHLTCCSAVALLLIVSSPLVGQFYGDSSLVIGLCLLAAEFWLRAGVAEPIWQLLNGLGDHYRQARLMGTHSLIRASATSGIVAFHSTVQGAATGLLLTSAVSAVLAWLVTKRLMIDNTSPPETDRDELHNTVRRWWTFGAFVDASLFFLPAATLWIAMAFSPEESLLGALTASYVLGQAIVPLLQAVNRGFVRLTAIKNEGEETDQARDVLTSVVQGLLPIAGMVLLLTLFGGAWLLSVLFGAKSDATWWLPAVVVLGMLGMSISHLFSEALGNAGWLKQRFLCVFTANVVSMAMTIELSRRWGPLGGAFAIGITGCGMLLALGTLLRYRIGGFWPGKGTICVVASAAAATVTGLILGPIHHGNWPLLIAPISIYCAGLILTQDPGSQKMLRFFGARFVGIAPSGTDG